MSDGPAPKLDAATKVVLSTLHKVFEQTPHEERVNLFAHLNNQDFMWLCQQVILHINDRELKECFQTMLQNRGVYLEQAASFNED